MNFEPNKIYHVYNQGNNHQKLFYHNDQYQYFLHLFKLFVLPNCDVLAWCLMPNHFHFMIYADARCIDVKQQGTLLLSPISNGYRKLLSVYSREFNRYNYRSGSLFRPKTKAKCLCDHTSIEDTIRPFSDYYLNCFHYIHENPVKDGITKLPYDWKWSSFNEYFKPKKHSFCNKELAYKFGLCDDRILTL